VRTKAYRDLYTYQEDTCVRDVTHTEKHRHGKSGGRPGIGLCYGQRNDLAPSALQTSMLAMFVLLKTCARGKWATPSRVLTQRGKRAI